MSHTISYDQDGQLVVQGHVICWKYTWLPELGFMDLARLAPCPWESYRVPLRSCLICKRVITTPASEGLVDTVPAYSKHWLELVVTTVVSNMVGLPSGGPFRLGRMLPVIFLNSHV